MISAAEAKCLGKELAKIEVEILHAIKTAESGISITPPKDIKHHVYRILKQKGYSVTIVGKDDSGIHIYWG